MKTLTLDENAAYAAALLTGEDPAATYIARRDRAQHPAGRFDGAGRWEPDAAERRACCDAIRTPSRTYPYSLLTHCRSLSHVAALFGVSEAALRSAVRAREPRAVRAPRGVWTVWGGSPDAAPPHRSDFSRASEARVQWLLEQAENRLADAPSPAARRALRAAVRAETAATRGRVYWHSGFCEGGEVWYAALLPPTSDN